MPLSSLQPITRQPAKQQALIDDLNSEISEINQLIESYNTNEQVDKLIEILRKKQSMENKYSPNLVKDFPGFLQLQGPLFVNLKKQFSAHGINNLSSILNLEKPTRSTTFSDILNNMEPEKVNQLIQILGKGSTFNRKALANLYRRGENPQFDAFIKNNSISYLGGGNSKNFKINPHDSPPYVLKIEDRMGRHKMAITHLQNDPYLKNILTPELAERHGTMTSAKGENSARTVVITEFFSGSDLKTHAEKRAHDTEARIDASLVIYKQMLQTLLLVQSKGCVFPDMKNENWVLNEDSVLNEQNQVFVVDTKGFFFSKDGRIDYETVTQEGGPLIHSLFLDPPEYPSGLLKPGGISVDAMHTHMFGKNLYQYLTGCSNEYLDKLHHFTQMDFNVPVFQGQDGLKLAELIQDTVRHDPSERIHLETALARLNGIQMERKRDPSALKQSTLRLLGQIEATGFGSADKKMCDFVKNYTSLINTSNNAEELTAINNKLQSVLNGQQAVNAVKQIVEGFRASAGMFTIGRKEKADRIELALCSIPIEERYRVKNEMDKLGHRVHREIAAHRKFNAFRSTDKIDEKLSAKCYTEFKNKLKAMKEKPKETNPQIDEVNAYTVHRNSM